MEKKQLLLRAAASGIVLALVIYWIAPKNLLNAFQQGDLILLIAAGMLFLAAQVLSAYKWFLIVKYEGGDFGVWSAVRIYFIGMFINNFLPTGLGGDVSRVLLVSRRANLSVGLSTWTVLFDRATGLLALIIISWVAAGWHFYGGAGLTGAIMVVLIGYAGLLAIRRHVQNILDGLPAGRQLNQLLYPMSKPEIWPAVLLSFAFNFLLITSVLLVAAGFGVAVGWPYMAITTLVASVSLLLPFFIGGYGAREAAFAFTLGYVGAEPGLAVAVGFTWGLLVSSVGLVGGALILIRERQRPTAINSP